MNETITCSIVGARILDPARGTDTVGDIHILDGYYVESIPPERRRIKFNGTGMIVMPSAIDLHVHFRDPGDSEAETMLSGTSAAFKGGIGTCVAMPNTKPPVDTVEAIHYQLQAKRFPLGNVQVFPSACCTSGREGREVAALEALAEAGAIAFTDDGAMVSDRAVMREVMLRAKALGKVVMDHAVLPELAGEGVIRSCPVAKRHRLPIFPPEAEVEAVAQDIELVRETGCALHIQHVSCAGSVEIIRAAQADGLPVTAEATPHHLALAAEDIPGNDANWKMNPPLGTREDVQALRQAVLEGTISCFATDHAPHTAVAKAKGFKKAPFGVIGLQTALPVTWQVMVREEGMAPLEWAKRWVCGPAAVLGLPIPTFTIGSLARVTMLYENPWKCRETDILSGAKNSPFIEKVFDLEVFAMLAGTPEEGLCEG